MKSKSSWIFRIPFYPLLLGIYPVLYLWAANYYQVEPFVILSPLLISLGLTGLTSLVTWLAFRNLRKAAIVTGLFLALFFFYGHFFDMIAGWKVFGIIVGRHLFVMLLWGLLFAAGVLWTVRARSDLKTLTWGFNLVTSFLVVLTLLQLAFFSLYRASTAQTTADETPTAQSTSVVQVADPSSPDVYYILMDGYDRQDLLKQDIGLDNQVFITQLEQLGFVLPSCTQSNYNTTVFSVAATLSMNYVDQMGYSYEELSKSDWGIEMSTPELEETIHSNTVMDQFQKMGYKVVTFEEPYPFINFPKSDIVFDNHLDTLSKMEILQFKYLFAKTTLLQRLIREAVNSPAKFKNLPTWLLEFIKPDFSTNLKYQEDLYQLNQLDHITQVPGKKFLYAHLLVTHPDFVFTPSGNLRSDTEETKAAYADQITYINKRILTIVKNILARSKTPPIIILQGDHGYGYGGRGVEQFKILNAYYLPQNGSAKLYPEITPVNTFRLILDNYFMQDYPLLPDQSIWIHADFPGGYQLEPGTCQ